MRAPTLFLVLISLVASLPAQAPVTRTLAGQPTVGWRMRLEGRQKSDSIVLTFGVAPDALTTEFKLTYDRDAVPHSGSIEMLIAEGGANPETTVLPLARRLLTMDEFVELSTADTIPVEALNVELQLISTQRDSLRRQFEKWIGTR